MAEQHTARPTRPTRQAHVGDLVQTLAAATVAWALHSLHHWDDRLAGLREIHRVLSPGGRMLLAERKLGREGSHSHGLTLAQAADLARQAVAVGFAEVATETRTSGSQTLVIVSARRA
jgi:SAM-dependent methyltransferase